MKRKLTKTAVEKLEPRDRNFLVWDSVFPGLAVVVTPKGAKSYALTYRTANGRQRRIAFARHPDTTPEVARKRAGQLRAQVSAGVDPLKERKRQRTAPTVAKLAEKFIAEHGKRRSPSTVRDYRAHFKRNIIPALGAATPVTAVTWEDVAKLHADMTDRGAATQANRAVAYGSSAWSFARKLGWVPRDVPNPWKGHERNRERRPGRALDREELARLGSALADDDSLAARALELVLLTGCRPGELRKARWGQVAKNLLHLEEAKTGARVVFLGAAAVEILDALPRMSRNPHVIPSPKGGAYSSFDAAWNRARDAAELDCRMYDLRHSFTSTAAALGVHPEHVRALVGHAPGQQAHRRYLHPAAHPDLRARLLADADRVSEYLSAALAGDLPNMEHGDVLEFRGAVAS